MISTVTRLGLSLKHLSAHGILIDVGIWLFNMRLATLYRVVATVCVLVADNGVRGDDDDDDDKTVTVTATTAQTLTTTSVRVEATPVAVPNIPPSAPPPAIATPTPSTAPPAQQSTPDSGDGNSTTQAAGPPAAAENPASAGEMTPAMNPDASAPGPGNAAAQPGSPSAAAQIEAPSAKQAPNRAPTVAAVQAQGMGREIDPAAGDLLGGNPPSKNVDLPVTIAFLLLFILGAFTHISIYRANAKRGHKFLLSDLMFDFCMIRSVTCIFRIIWVFSQLRGIVLAAQIFFNGG